MTEQCDFITVGWIRWRPTRVSEFFGKRMSNEFTIPDVSPFFRADASRENLNAHTFVQRLKQRIDSLVPLPSRILLAISGGADSVALLRGWMMARKEFGDHLVVATFDHELRPESIEDVRFVCRLASELQIECEVGRPSVPLSSSGGRSLEGAARAARYDFLIEAARKHRVTHVATAHTASDQAETILHRIIRGTGLRGLAGIVPKRPLDSEIDLIRPMLELTREDVESFLEKIRQPFQIDSTNGDRRFTRNRIRHELLPQLRAEFNPMVGTALCQLAELARLASENEDRLIQGLISRVVRERTKHTVYFDRAELCLLGEYQATSLIRAVMEQQRWPLRRMGKTHLTRIARLCHLHRSTRISLPAGMFASLNRREGVVSIIRLEEGKQETLSTDEAMSDGQDNP
ncbi:tRNA lysidine(34) synthetase TilS [bacterium]|nr:tRNA lysidine(34) synthetase TilS [bacterium]